MDDYNFSIGKAKMYVNGEFIGYVESMSYQGHSHAMELYRLKQLADRGEIGGRNDGQPKE